MPMDPTDPGFWDVRYEAGRTPWEFPAVPAPLARFLARHPGHGARVLIPGCGSAHELPAFAAAGYVPTAVDFSTAAVARARATLPPHLEPCLLAADFFLHPFPPAPFDLIYERTFLCALPPSRWPAVSARCARLLRPGGRLIGLFFHGAKEDGPPFGLAPDEAGQLFGSAFEQLHDDPVPAAESAPLFAGQERWQEWRRR